MRRQTPLAALAACTISLVSVLAAADESPPEAVTVPRVDAARSEGANDHIFHVGLTMLLLGIPTTIGGGLLMFMPMGSDDLLAGAVTMMVGGGVLTATGATLLIVAPDDEEPQAGDVAISIAPNQAGFSVRF
jgi:hypothetical protein